jgi:hypothetical protein
LLACESVHISGLQPGETFALNSLVRTVAPGLPNGTYTFGVVIDRLGEVNEADETNNAVWLSSRRLHVGATTGVSRWRRYR